MQILTEFKTKQTQNKQTIWWAFYRYFPDLKGSIAADTINQHHNAMTMFLYLHVEFGNNNLAFEHLSNVSILYKGTHIHLNRMAQLIMQGIQNRYRSHFYKYPLNEVPEVVDLTSKDPSIPLPNSIFLNVHFRITEILSVSGIGQRAKDVMEKGTWDSENIDPSGSTDLGSILCRKMLMDI